MPRLTWGGIGERGFEAGVDRGVLYPTSGFGVPWNGLLGVTQSLSGGEEKGYYVDGQKYLATLDEEDFGGSIEAFTYPDEFAECDGSYALDKGLNVSQQRRKPFGLSYRTFKGNDVDSLDHGYKIHIIYNALARPSEKAYKSLGSTMEAMTFNWDFSTVPVFTGPGLNPSAHIVIDTTKTDEVTIDRVENMLYGTPVTPATLPTIAELQAIFALSTEGLVVIDNGDGTWTATGTSDQVWFVSSTEFRLSSPAVTQIDDNSYRINVN